MSLTVPPVDSGGARLRLAVVVAFADEERYLPRLLASIAGQSEPPDELLLVDDGSRDRSPELAEEFAAEHGYARVLRLPSRARAKDRLEGAPELKAFRWGVDQLQPGWQIVAKVDGDLELSATLCEEIRDAFLADPRLGITGSYLSTITPSGARKRERHVSQHVRGPNKFYRRECYELISPLPEHLGWDEIDTLRARRLGWHTRSLESRSGDSLHLRPTGSRDGSLRAFRRWGRCAWAYGAHPLWVLLIGLRFLFVRPFVLAGLAYLFGWLLSAARRYPRAEADVIAHCRVEEFDRVMAALRLPPGAARLRPLWLVPFGESGRERTTR